jgi:hypothetical protein
MTNAATRGMTVDEPIEIRLDREHARNGNTIRPGATPYVLVAYRTERGTIGHDLSIGGAGQSEAMSNIQSKAVFPRKAVKGWQAEVVAFAEASLYKVVEVR